MAYDHDTGGGNGTFDLFALMRVDTAQLWTLGFHNADPFTSNASDFFADVERVVTGGVAWTGEGQPQASVVMRSNAAALQTAKLQMRAGISAVDGLATAISKAQQEVNAILSTQTGMDFDLRDHTVGSGGFVEVFIDSGTVEIYSNGVVNLKLSTSDVPTPVHETQFQLDSVMTYARSADLTAKQLLDRINAARPVFSASATAVTLAYNTTLRSIAATNLILAGVAQKTWTELGPFDWEPLPDMDRWDWSDAVENAFLPLDPRNITDVSFWDLKDGVLEILDKTLHTGKKAIPYVGLAFTAYDFLEGGHKVPESVDSLGVRTPFEAPHATDPALQSLVAAYYPGGDPGTHLTLRQAARLDGIGALADDGHDYVEDARRLDEQLEDWSNGTLEPPGDRIGPAAAEPAEDEGDWSAEDERDWSVADAVTAFHYDRELAERLSSRLEPVVEGGR